MVMVTGLVGLPLHVPLVPGRARAADHPAHGDGGRGRVVVRVAVVRVVRRARVVVVRRRRRHTLPATAWVINNIMLSRWLT